MEELSRAMSAAGDDDLDYLVRRAIADHQDVPNFVLLNELIRRRDHNRSVQLLSNVDWGEIGWGDAWHADVEFRLAQGFAGPPALAGLDVLLDATARAAMGPIRDHLRQRVRFTFGPMGVGQADDEHLVETARAWLGSHRESAEVNDRYYGFVDMGGPMGPEEQFGMPHAQYVLRQAKAPEPPPPTK